MASNSSDKTYTKLTGMDRTIGPPIASKPYTLPLKQNKWAQKELKILEKTVIIQ